MRKLRLAILSAVVISIVVGSTFAAVTLTSASAQPKTLDPVFSYTAKFICNIPQPKGVLFPGAAESIGLVPGEYKTDINVHNSNPFKTLNVTNEFVLSVPGAPFVNVTSRAFSVTVLTPDAAFFITCDEIFSLLHLKTAAKGWVTLTTTSTDLDVWAQYTGETFSNPSSTSPFPPATATTSCVLLPPPVGTCVSTGHSLNIERIIAEPVPASICALSSTIAVSPSSIVLQVGVSGVAIVTVTNESCVPIIEVFNAISVSPNVPGGPTITTLSGMGGPEPNNCVGAICLAPGASGSVDVTFSAGFVQGVYTITVSTAIGGSAVGQTATLQLTVTPIT